MKRLRHAGIPGIVLALAAAQGLVMLGYRKVALHREAIREPSVRYERLSGAPGPDLVLLSPDGSSRRLGEVPPEVMRVNAASASEHYDVSLLPDTFLLDADGAMHLRFGGARDWRTRHARELLRAEMDRGRTSDLLRLDEALHRGSLPRPP